MVRMSTVPITYYLRAGEYYYVLYKSDDISIAVISACKLFPRVACYPLHTAPGSSGGHKGPSEASLLSTQRSIDFQA